MNKKTKKESKNELSIILKKLKEIDGLKRVQSEMKKGQVEIRKDQNEMRKEQSEMKKEQSEMRKEQIEMKKEQSEMRKEQIEMKKEQSEMRKEQSEMKKEQSEIKKEQSEMKKEQGEMRKEQNKMKKVQDEHGKVLGEIKNVQKEQGKTLDLLVEKYADHEDRFVRIEENMFTKEDGQKILDAIDSFAGTVSRLDDENIVGNSAVKRIGDEVAEQGKVVIRHEVEIQKLKKKMAVG